MAVRFNPPPGWQVPPGFRPDAGWVPDPAWPPAPQGWDYWVDDTTAPRRARPESPVEATTVMAPVRAAAVAPAPAAATTVTAMPPLPPSAPTATFGAPVATVTTPPPPPPAAIPAPGPAGGHLAQADDRGAVSTVSAALRTVGDRIRTSSGRRAERLAADAAAETTGTRTRSGARGRGGRGGPLIAGVAAACLALGCILGVTISMMRSSDAAQDLVDAGRKEATAQQLKVEAQQAQEDLAAQKADVQKREQALKEREKAAEAKEAELASQQKAFQDQQTQQQQQQEEQQQQQQQDPAWFFLDCNAARAAGAAPIQNGQPAYRGALDANGNGIACEAGE
ncbi:excalibur calcium-binding domain-containing protein [Krasilnikoviella flava]|uniref:Excalibur calcium-binding domain-containing protein n=1 Tax=Krasilnikoviella flava TaxID=526729 RepID=A0A1T5M043_9MICO|nr:excalibur calcium-binding domain-containing protein [Krasilnikoviella flava]SKC81582.1 Excalibur calcium-binding domain-containing protein [Krasilnikoviella flava]